MTSGLLRPRNIVYPDLTTALKLTGPSRTKDKLQNDKPGSHDPIIDHLMSSRAFKVVMWSFLLGVMTFGSTITIINPRLRASFVMSLGWRLLGLVVPGMTLLVLPFSRRLR